MMMKGLYILKVRFALYAKLWLSCCGPTLVYRRTAAAGLSAFIFKQACNLQIFEHREQWSVSAWEAVLQIFKINSLSDKVASNL